MKKVLFAVMMLMVSGSALALEATLISDNVGSGSAAPSTLLFMAEGAADAGGMAVGAVPSTATWDWDSASGVLTGTGLYFPVIHIGSNPMGATILGDHVVDLVINTQAGTTSATSYECREGNFLAGVGANGCLNLSLGSNFALDTTVAWNVGDDANCVQRSLNSLPAGDDISTGNPRGLFTAAAGGGCDAVDGAFDLWEVIEDPGPGNAGTLIIGNFIAANQGAAADGARTLTFEVAEGPAGPTAVDDDVTTPQDTPVDIPVLENDSVTGDAVTVTIPSDPTSGTALVNNSPGDPADISITYTPNAGFFGSDSFTYTVDDGTGQATATVNVTVNETGANDDTAETPVGTPVDIPVLENDVGLTDPVTVTIDTDPANGQVTVNGSPGNQADITITYTPDPGFKGPTDTFIYQVDDGTVIDTATVTVTVTNATPTIQDGDITTIEDTPSAAFPLVFTDGDGTSTFSITTQASNGTCDIAGSSVTYTPDPGFVGADSCVVTIEDEDGDTDAATLNITVSADVAPTIQDGDITTDEGTPSAAFALVFTAGNGTSTFSITTQASNGTCDIAGSSVTYTPNAGFVGTDSCVVTIEDEDGDTDTATLSITVEEVVDGGSGGGGPRLPGGSSLDFTLLSLLGSLSLLRLRRAARGRRC